MLANQIRQTGAGNNLKIIPHIFHFMTCCIGGVCTAPEVVSVETVIEAEPKQVRITIYLDLL